MCWISSYKDTAKQTHIQTVSMLYRGMKRGFFFLQVRLQIRTQKKPKPALVQSSVIHPTYGCPYKGRALRIRHDSKMVLEWSICWWNIQQELLVFSKVGFTTMSWQSLDTKSTSTRCQSLTLMTVQVHILSGRTSINISTQNTVHNVTASEIEVKINAWSGKQR